MLSEISTFLQELPPYIGQGLMSILVTICAGIVLGYVTSKVFIKRDELTRIQGVLLEKKIPIYKEIFQRVENFNNLVEHNENSAALALRMLEEAGFEKPKFIHLPSLFDNPDNLKDTFLDFDRYATENKIYFDEDVAKEVFIFQNYIITCVRLHTIFQEQLDMYRISRDEKVLAVKHQLFIALGMILMDDLFRQTQKLSVSIRNSLNNRSFNHRVAPTYRYDDLNASEGLLHQALHDSVIISEHDKIHLLITKAAALALIAGGIFPDE